MAASHEEKLELSPQLADKMEAAGLGAYEKPQPSATPPAFAAILRRIDERGPDPYCGFEEILCQLLRQAIERERLANMRTDRAEEALADTTDRLEVCGKMLNGVADVRDELKAELASLRSATPEMPPEPFPNCLAEGFGDPETLLNSRAWLEKAIVAQRAKVTGAGIGMGQADISFTLDGCEFNVSLRPIIGNRS